MASMLIPEIRSMLAEKASPVSAVALRSRLVGSPSLVHVYAALNTMIGKNWVRQEVKEGRAYYSLAPDRRPRK